MTTGANSPFPFCPQTGPELSQGDHLPRQALRRDEPSHRPLRPRHGPRLQHEGLPPLRNKVGPLWVKSGGRQDGKKVRQMLLFSFSTLNHFFVFWYNLLFPGLIVGGLCLKNLAHVIILDTYFFLTKAVLGRLRSQYFVLR